MYATFPEGTEVSVIACRSMNASFWHDLNIVVSCTIVPCGHVDAIVTARENVRGPWNEEGEQEERTEQERPEKNDQLREHVEQLAIWEDELTRNLGQYVQQQTRLSELIEGIRHQLKRLESNSIQNIEGRDFPTPRQSKNPVRGAHFQVKAYLDIGKFSGMEPTPQDELTFEQWVCDVCAYQRQFPNFILLPAMSKSIRGKAMSVLRSLDPEFTIDEAIATLAREYEGVANSDIFFKDFYQMHQEKSKKVQVFSVRLREALN